MEGESCLLQLRRWQRRQDSLGRNPAGPIGPLSRAFFGAVESAPQELEQWRQHMAVERSGEIQCAEVRRPRGFPPKIGRDLPKIGRSRKRRESARNAASSLFWAARPPLSYLLPALNPDVTGARRFGDMLGLPRCSRRSRACRGADDGQCRAQQSTPACALAAQHVQDGHGPDGAERGQRAPNPEVEAK